MTESSIKITHLRTMSGLAKNKKRFLEKKMNEAIINNRLVEAEILSDFISEIVETIADLEEEISYLKCNNEKYMLI